MTPVDVNKLQQLLFETEYDQEKTKFIVQGFSFGFSLQYEGSLHKCKRMAPNLKLKVGSKTEL